MLSAEAAAVDKYQQLESFTLCSVTTLLCNQLNFVKHWSSLMHLMALLCAGLYWLHFENLLEAHLCFENLLEG